MSKSRDEVEKLKADWLRDPIFDLEDTEGFEEHREELKGYAHAMNEQWAAAKRQRRAVIRESQGLVMSVRDHVAIRAMQGLMANIATTAYHENPEGVAALAYLVADAMLLERMKEQQ